MSYVNMKLRGVFAVLSTGGVENSVDNVYNSCRFMDSGIVENLF